MGETSKRGPRDVLSGAGERRLHKRFLPRACDMTLIPETLGLLRILGSSKKNIAQAVVDLAEGGCRFVTRGEMPVGRKVNVMISVKLFNDTINTQGVVAWCSAHAQRSGCFYVGVRFDKADPVRSRKIQSIRDYLNSPE